MVLCPRLGRATGPVFINGAGGAMSGTGYSTDGGEIAARATFSETFTIPAAR